MSTTHSMHCPKCSELIQVRPMSMREMRDEVLTLAGFPQPEPDSTNRYSAAYAGNVNKEQMKQIYEYVLRLAEKNGAVCPVPGE